MIDISQKPFFQYNKPISDLIQPIQKHENLDLLCFARIFNDNSRFIITPNKEWWVDYFNNDLYRFSTYANKYQELNSAFYMWDHLPYSPPEIYEWSRQKFNISHGLSIIQQQGDFCDSFVFATKNGTHLVNNFYLNYRNNFIDFMDSFYDKMAEDLIELENHTFSLPEDTVYVSPNHEKLTPRQRDCLNLLGRGFSAKEIAKMLNLSPRTVETHLDHLREKFNAKNRAQLLGHLKQIL